jgi:hypothetical protein
MPACEALAGSGYLLRKEIRMSANDFKMDELRRLPEETANQWHDRLRAVDKTGWSTTGLQMFRVMLIQAEEAVGKERPGDEPEKGK